MADTGQTCEDLTIKQIIIGGKDGAPGVPGPPGSSIQLPITANDVTVTNAGFTTVQDVLDDLLFVPVNIESFETPVTLFENRGSTDASADFTMNFEWTLNKSIVGGSQTLLGPAEMTPESLTAADRDKLVTLTDFNTTSIFTLTSTEASGGISVVPKTITFTNKIYYGDRAIPGAVDDNFIQALENVLQTTTTINVNSNTPASDNPKTYFWYAYPTSGYGTPLFTVGGFPLDTQPPILVSYTNLLGHTENYNVIRATNHSLGSIFVNIT
jgi:hypothetical protein